MKAKILFLLALVSFIFTVIAYPSLPDEIAIHFNAMGEADNYGSKSMIFLTASIPFAIMALFKYLPSLDPKKAAYEKFQKSYNMTATMAILLLIVVHWTTLLLAQGYDLNISLIVQVAASIMFIVIGNYLGQIKPNYFTGIKTPWTLASETVWIKTHRMTGKYFVLAGFISLFGLLLPQTYHFILLIVPTLLVAIGSVIYSYVIYQKEQAN